MSSTFMCCCLSCLTCCSNRYVFNSLVIPKKDTEQCFFESSLSRWMNIFRVVPMLLSPGDNQMNTLRQPFLVEITIMQCVLNGWIEVFMNFSANLPFKSKILNSTFQWCYMFIMLNKVIILFELAIETIGIQRKVVLSCGNI